MRSVAAAGLDPETRALLLYLRALINLLGFSRRDVAHHLGVSRSSVGRLLSGEKELQLADLRSICTFLDSEPEEIVFLATLDQPTNRWLTRLRAN